MTSHWAWGFLSLGILVGGGSIWSGLTLPDPHFVARNRNYCNMNLQRLYYCLQEYATENASHYPDSLSTLAHWDLQQGHPIDEYICPAAQSNGYLTPTPTTQAILDQISTAPQYIYLGVGKTTLCDPKEILLYDPPTNHPTIERGGDGMHVLYGNGDIKWFEGREKKNMLKAIDATGK